MPVSINAAHAIGRNRRGGHMVRSPEYTAWVQYAGIAWRDQFSKKRPQCFEGRIKVEYIFVWVDGARGTTSSDLDNRIKVLQDFLQGKFYVNDKQIDQFHAFRRLRSDGESHVIVRVTEIPDFRHSH